MAACYSVEEQKIKVYQPWSPRFRGHFTLSAKPALQIEQCPHELPGLNLCREDFSGGQGG